MGQLLQQLAMSDADDGDPRRKSSLSKFDKVRIPKLGSFLVSDSETILFGILHTGHFTL